MVGRDPVYILSKRERKAERITDPDFVGISGYLTMTADATKVSIDYIVLAL